MLSRMRLVLLPLQNSSVSAAISFGQYYRVGRVFFNSYSPTDFFKRSLNDHGNSNKWENQIEESLQIAKTTPRHILELTRDEKQQFLDSFDQVLSDCDGVLWDMEKIFPDSGTVLQLLKDAGKTTTFVSNNSLRSDKEYLERFKTAGIDVGIDSIIHPAKSIIQYFKSISFDGLVYCLGSMNMRKQLTEAGYKLLDVGPEIHVEDGVSNFARHTCDKQPVKAVVLDIDLSLTVVNLVKADQYLKEDDCIFICGASDRTIKFGNFGSAIGPGPFIKLLETAANKKAIVLGKPGKELSEQLLKNKIIRNPKRLLFIGDLLEQDIQFGHGIGCQTLLVLSGNTTREELMNVSDPAQTPDYYADSLSDFKEFFACLKCKTTL